MQEKQSISSIIKTQNRKCCVKCIQRCDLGVNEACENQGSNPSRDKKIICQSFDGQSYLYLMLVLRGNKYLDEQSRYMQVGCSVLRFLILPEFWNWLVDQGLGSTLCRSKEVRSRHSEAFKERGSNEVRSIGSYI